MSLQPKLASNPLQDDELSDVTKREIKFWANKLKVTPSQLFSLTKGELDTLLESVIHGENSQPQQHDKQAERSERLSKMKQKLLEGNEKDRLKGGLDLLELLCHAAQDIENYLCGQANDQTYDVDDTDFTESSGEETPTYEPSCPRAASTPISCGPAAASTPISCGPAAASTPYGDDTYTVGGQNATYNVGGQNATYNVPQNATYNVPQNATFNVPQNATCPIECPNATYNVGGHNATYNVGSSSPRGGPVAASTPYGSPNSCTMDDDTFSLRCRNATDNAPLDTTFNISPQNATLTESPLNTTYTISSSPKPADASAVRSFMASTPHHIRSPHEDSPYSLACSLPPTPTPPSIPGFSLLSSSFGASRSRGSQPSPGRYQTRSITQSSGAPARQICPAPPPNSPADRAPRAMNFIGDQDYAMRYGPCGSEETGASRPRWSQPSRGRYQTRTITQSSGASSCPYGGAPATQICPAPSANSPGDWAPQAVSFIDDPDYAMTYGPCDSEETGASRPRGSQPSRGRYQTRTITQSSEASSCPSGGAYGGAPATQVCPAPSANSPGDWEPQAMHFIGDEDNRTFRNYTNHEITYGPCGSEETTNSISVESFDSVSGKVTTCSETFSLPPACSPTDALGLVGISPPLLASGARPGASPGAARARSRLNHSDLAATSPPPLTPGCTSSPQRTPISCISPPLLASGAGGGMSPRECSPSPLRQQPPGRNPQLSPAIGAGTPRRVKPNRPYRPRRIC